MNFLPVLIALVLIPAAGVLPALLAMGRREKISAVELLALSALLGCGLVSIGLAGCGLVMRGYFLQMTVTAGCVLSGVQGVRHCRENRIQIQWPRPRGAVEWILCAVLLAGFAAIVFIQYKTALLWDGLLVWEIKARFAFLNGGPVPHAYFTDPSRAWSHPDYPLMLPMLESWIYLWIGDCDQFWVRVISLAFFGLAALVLYSGVRNLCGKKQAGLAAAALLFFVPISVAGFAIGGYADLPLGVFYLAATSCFLRSQFEERPAAQLCLLSLFAGLMPWIKREGIVLWICLMALVLVELLRQRKFSAAAFVIAPGAAVWAGWKIAMAAVAVKAGTDFVPFSVATLQGNFSRLAVGVLMLGMEFVKIKSWSLLWVLFPVALICLAALNRRKMAAQLLLLVAAPLLLLSCSFVFSSWTAYQDHILTSLPRLALQVSPVALLAIGLAAGGSATRKNPGDGLCRGA